MPASLVVATIIALCCGITLPVISKVRQAAQRTRCQNNLKQIALSVLVCHDVSGHFPTGTLPNAGLPHNRRLSWLVTMTQYVEASALYSRTDKAAAWDAAQNRPHTDRNWKTYTCPATADPVNTAATSYVGVAGVGPGAAALPPGDPRAGVFGYERRTHARDVADGNSFTLLLVETPTGGPWAQGGPGTVRGFDPGDQPYLGIDRPFGSPHRGGESQPLGRTRPGCHVAMADANVRFVTDRVAPESWEALATIAGQEPFPADW